MIEELDEIFDSGKPQIYGRLIKKYERLFELRKNRYVLNAKANFPDSNFRPYIDLYLRVSESHRFEISELDFIIFLYKELKLTDFKEILIQQRKYDHTKKTRNEKYIRDLFNYKPELLVIRIALRYKEGCLLPEHRYAVKNYGEYNKYLKRQSKKVKDDLKSLIKLLKVIYKNDLTGYMWKLRYDAQKQFYYQLMIFLNGDKYTKDVAIAKKICGLWKDIVTSGYGECTNYNAYKKLHTNLGLGIKSRDKKELVIQEARVLIEDDYFVSSMLSGNQQRTFSKGHIPNKTRSGRPSIMKKF